jgi:hypothetical protein
MRRLVVPSKSFADLVLDSMPDLATVKNSLGKAIMEKRALLRSAMTLRRKAG